MTERFSASVAARHMACPASANLEVAIKNWVPPVEDRTANNAANRGTAKHEMLAPIMELPASEMRMMARAIEYAADLCAGRRFKRLIEHSVTADWLVSKPTTTVDLALYVQDEIHIIDWKWGKIPVDVWHNIQLLYYGVSLMHLAPKAKGINFHIVQPPADNLEHWFADTHVIDEFIQRALEAEAKVLAKDTTFGPSDECKFCPANPYGRGEKGRPFCPAQKELLGIQTIVDVDAILSL